MNSFFENVRKTILSGIIFLMPVFAVVFLLQKVWNGMTGYGQQIATFFGVKTFAGVGPASIMKTILLIVIFYGCGLLVRFAMVTRMREWIETNLLVFVPGYLKYRVKMEEKLLPPVDSRPTVLVRMGHFSKPGLLMGTSGGKAIVFLPSTPDTDNGEVVVMPEQDIEMLTMTAKELKSSLQMSGSGLKV